MPQTLLALALLLVGCSGLRPAPYPPRPSAPLSAGTTLRLWQDSAIFDVVRRLIDGVDHGQQLWVEMYEFGRPDLAAQLLRARHMGADVRLIVDPTVSVSARTAVRLAAVGPAGRPYPVDGKRRPSDQRNAL